MFINQGEKQLNEQTTTKHISIKNEQSKDNTTPACQ